ncbi:MAG: helix-turn-helix domain-containing protein [Planctomycetota bacterium]|nr:helix-turn-helix domain-containing protein [Planctomycetota bacterium]
MPDTSINLDQLLNQLASQIADSVVVKLRWAMPEAEQARDLEDEPTMAEQLGVSQQTLQRRRTAGEVPFVRLGRRVLYRPADVFAALSEKQNGGKQ